MYVQRTFSQFRYRQPLIVIRTTIWHHLRSSGAQSIALKCLQRVKNNHSGNDRLKTTDCFYTTGVMTSALAFKRAVVLKRSVVKKRAGRHLLTN